MSMDTEGVVRLQMGPAHRKIPVEQSTYIDTHCGHGWKSCPAPGGFRKENTVSISRSLCTSSPSSHPTRPHGRPRPASEPLCPLRGLFTRLRTVCRCSAGCSCSWPCLRGYNCLRRKAKPLSVGNRSQHSAPQPNSWGTCQEKHP